MEREDFIYVGHRHEWGGDAPFGFEIAPRRQHVYVIGQTGSGKSTLLRNLILQDIEAGRGVALIDPHGDLAADILDNLPPWRTDDVVYFDPASPDPLAINLFRATSDNRRGFGDNQASRGSLNIIFSHQRIGDTFSARS